MNHKGETIGSLWSRLEGLKRPFMDRAERYAALTLPRILLPEGTDTNAVGQTHDFQSIGAVAVNHVVNKLALAMFSPAKPFFRIGLDNATKKQLATSGVTETEAGAKLAVVEKDAADELDVLGQRPKLYSALRHLVVVGNTVVKFDDEVIRQYGLGEFCVKRNKRGEVHTLVVREHIKFDELEEDVQALLGKQYNADTMVNHYTLICRQIINRKPHYVQRVAIDEIELLDKKYQGRWLEHECPWRVLTWDLADKADYASSLVEEYQGDLEALSMLAESVVTGGVLGAEFRYLINPTMNTSAEDFNKSKNGSAMAGMKGDIDVITGGNPEALKVADAVAEKYERRVSRAFLLNSAVTRDAERVTAEEIRMTAMELETSFGGTYTALASTFQAPVAYWLLDRIDSNILGTKLRVVVLTGLDALSRNGELENFRLAVADLAAFATVPPMILQRFKFDAIAEFIGSRRGVDFKAFLKSDEEIAREQAQAIAQQAALAGQTAQAETAGTNEANQGIAP